MSLCCSSKVRAKFLLKPAGAMGWRAPNHILIVQSIISARYSSLCEPNYDKMRPQNGQHVQIMIDEIRLIQRHCICAKQYSSHTLNYRLRPSRAHVRLTYALRVVYHPAPALKSIAQGCPSGWKKRKVIALNMDIRDLYTCIAVVQP